MPSIKLLRINTQTKMNEQCNQLSTKEYILTQTNEYRIVYKLSLEERSNKPLKKHSNVYN